MVILETILNLRTEKCVYGNFNHRCNDSPFHLHAFLVAGSARDNNLEVQIYFLKDNKGNTVRKRKKIN
jgi:hypothetical protein